MDRIFEQLSRFFVLFSYYTRALFFVEISCILYGASIVYLADEHSRLDVFMYQFLPGTAVVLIILPSGLAICSQIFGRKF